MARTAVLVFGAVVYAQFLVVFLAAVGFVTNLGARFGMPRTLDNGPAGEALLVNLLLLGLFGLQHSVMARRGFKRVWTRLVPPPIERSTYVLATNAVLILLFRQWRPMPTAVWSVELPWLATLLQVLAWCGWGLVLLSTFLIDHFELFGLRQAVNYFRGRTHAPAAFRLRSLYRGVRHPLYLGFLVAFWSTPYMTQGHLLFAVVTTLYILVAIQLEERDLVAEHGEAYAAYRRSVPMLLPWRGRR